MGKKLLSVFFILSIFFLSSFNGFGQCDENNPPTVIITSSDSDNTICAGEAVTFTAEAENVGSNPRYQWQVNGLNHGTNGASNIFTTTTLQNNYSVRVILTSDCSTVPTVTSSGISTMVNAIPSAPSVTGDNSVCAGDSINLTASTISGATYNWTLPDGSTVIGKDLTLAGATATMSGTYTVTATVNDCKSTAGTYSVTVNPIPGTPTAGNGGAVCAGGTINLTASNISGATYAWSGPGGFTSNAQNPTRLGATTAMAGVYTVTATINECTSTAATTTVAVNSAPTAPTAGNAGAVCVGGTINLTASNISGATYAWTGPGSWTSNVQNPSRSGATTAMGGTYSVIAIVNGCPSTSATTNVTVNTIPAAPTAGNGGAVCVGGTITLTTPTVTGATYSWTGPNNFTSSSQNPSIPNTTTAMAGAYNITVTVNGCTSAAGTTNVVVNTIPTVTATTPGERCGSGTVTLGATASSGIVNWYSAASGGSVLGTGTSFTTPSISSTTSYYVDATANGCTTGTRTEVIATVKNIPTITATTPGNVCTTGPVTLSATASAGTINWYTSATGGTSLHTGATYTTPSISTTTTYYVDATLNGCTTSSRTPVIATVTTVPTITGTTPGSRCGTGTVELKATASAGTVTWFSTNTSTTPLATGNSYSPNISANTTFYVAAVLNGCSSARTAVTANTYSVAPSTGNGNNAGSKPSGPNSVCPGPAAINLKYTIPTSMTENAQSYNWSLPPGFNITSGAGTREITVSVPGAGAVSGNNNIFVTANNPCGTSGPSSALVVTVGSFAAVNAGPDVSICLGADYTLINTLSGSANDVTWAIVNGSGTITGGPYPAPFVFKTSSQGSATLRATTNTATGSCSASTGVDDVIITINQPPSITTQPIATQTLCSGSTATLSVAATGTGLTYQWKKDETNVSGGTGATLNLNNITTTNAGNYTVVVSGTSPCTSVTSQVSQLIVNQAVAITAQPVATQTICSGTTANFSVTATGTGLSYQWKKDGVDIANATSSTLAITNTTSSNSGNYTVVVSGTSPCSAVTSSVSTLTVNDAIQITTQPAATQTLCAGSEATFGVVASGTGSTYQWQKNGTNIPNATSSTYTIGNTSSNDTGNYTVVVSGAAPCSAVTSSVASLTVNTPSVAPTSLSASVSSICNGANTSVTLSQTGGSLGTGAVWKWYTDATYTTVVSGTVTAQGGITLSPTATTTYYLRAENTADPCTPIVSGPSAGVTVTVNEPSIAPTALTASSPEICNGNNTSVTLTPTGGSLGTNAVWKWYTNSNYTTPVNGTVGTDGIITVTPTVTTTYYLRAEGNAVPCTANVNGPSSGVTVTVNEPVVITTDLDDSATVSVCAGFPFEFEIQATGTNLTYQWQLNGQNITGANSAKLSVSQAATSNAGTYQVIVNGTESCSQQVSRSVELNVNQSITISSQPAPTSTVCEDSVFSLSVVADGNISSYLWRKNGIPISEGNGITGTETATLNFSSISVADNGNYDVVISSPAESCSQIISTPAEINVNNKSENPTGISASSEAICAGDSTVLTLQGGGNGTNEEIKWYTDNQGNNLVGTGNGISVSPTVTTTYYGRFETPAPCSYNSEWVEIAITVNDASTITLDTAEATTGQTICINSPLTPIVYSIGGGGLSASITAGQLPAGVTGDFADGKFTISGTPSESGTFNYTVTTEGPCEEEFLSGTIKVNPAPVANILEEDRQLEICFDGTAYNITAGAEAENYASILWSVPTGTGTISSETSLTEATYTPASGVSSVVVTLTVYGLPGCSMADTATKEIFIQPLPTVTAITYEGGQTEFCDNQASSQPSITGTNAYQNGTFTWAPADGENEGNELIIDTTTGTISTGSDPGIYDVTYSTPEGEICGVISRTLQITISKLPDASFNYNAGAFCKSSGGNQSPTISGDTGGVFTASTGLSIDTNGVINVAGSTANDPNDETDVHTVTYTFASDGICEEVSTTVNVRIDAPALGGELSFFKGEQEFGRLFKTCEINERTSGLIADLVLANYQGKILGWVYKTASGEIKTVKNSNDSNFTDSTLPGSVIESLGLTQTTVFQVQISGGACTPNSFVASESAILSVISSQIEPTPVTADKAVICIDDPVLLTAVNSYEQGTVLLDQGAFDNSSITNHGWRIRRKGSTNNLDFNSSADNGRANIWLRTNPVDLRTANINTNAISLQRWDSGASDNKGFAVVSGNNPGTLETAVFGLNNLDQAILTFDQAYNLTSGASIKVEISLDGGNTYLSVPLYEVIGSASSGNYNSFGTGNSETRPLNKIKIDLGNYLGQNNLRLRFNFEGVRDGDVWAVDSIDVPKGPANVGIIWQDHTGDTTVVIGTNFSETWIPKEIGWNISDITTTLEYSNGSCTTAVHSEEIRVFAFDRWTTSVTAEYGSCGNYSAQLSATATGAVSGPVISYPTPDEHIGKWNIIGDGSYSLTNIESTDNSDPLYNPNVLFTATDFSSFSVTWELIPQEKDANGNTIVNPGCPPVPEPYEISFEECIALDFDGFNDHIVIDDPYEGVVSIEAWIRPEVAGGTIISGPNFKVTTPAGVTLNSRWYHIAVSGGRLYIDGIDEGALSLGSGGVKTLIGAEWVSGEADNFFSGWIEEVRLWKKALTIEQIQFMMNQRLIANGAQMGEQIPMDVPGALEYSDLAGYYRLISAEPEHLDVSPVIYLAEDMPANGLTPDRAANKTPGRLINMETNQKNTAPLPYYSNNNGTWGTDETWLRPDVWDPPHTGSIEWNIVRTSHDINSGSRDIKLLGLISEKETLDMQGTNPGVWQTGAGGSGNELFISHYLLLNGVIDLNGESQLVQPEGSIVDSGSGGELHRDQQGTANSYNYNYWSSPVSLSAGNTSYTVAGVLRDGTNLNASPGAITFGDPYAFADGDFSTPIKISNYWISTFKGISNDYFDWNFQYGSAGSINIGEGFTMKGTSGKAAISDTQNYTFVGIPNNGEVDLEIAKVNLNLEYPDYTSYLIGNPYPSAIDAEKFILDNLVEGGNNENSFNGTLYFWSHFEGGDTHILKEYIGGYAIRNLAGGTKAIANDARIDSTKAIGGQRPERYIPVGQSFFVNTVSVFDFQNNMPQNATQNNPSTVHGGVIHFKNGQRFFQPEGDNHSVFHKPEIVIKGNKEVKDHTDKRSKFWLKFESPKGYHREILVAADENTTDGFDLGYDAPMIEYNIEDMFWLLGSIELVIQGVPDFDKARVIPLGLVVDESKEFTIKIEELKNIPDESTIYLKDKLKDTIHDLRKSAYVSTSEPGYINERFEIVFLKEIPTTEPEPNKPGEEIDYGVELSFRHAHVGRELQILNPKQVPINELILFDMNGKLVTTYKNIAHEKEVRLPVRNFSAGVYIAKLYSEHGVITKKIIIQN